MSELIDLLREDIDALQSEVNDLWAALDAIPEHEPWWQWITNYRRRRAIRRVLSYSSHRIDADAGPDTT